MPLPRLAPTLAELWVYVAMDDPDAADRFVEDLIAKFPRLAEFPLVGRERDELAPRQRSVAVGGYLIFYRPIEGGETVRVLSGHLGLDSVFPH